MSTLLTYRNLCLLAAAGSLGMLLAALAFQFIGDLAPCPMCIWQRWPHVVAVLAGGIALVTPLGAWLGALAMLVNAGLSLYHTGVERAWWEGPDTCTTAPIGGLSPDELFNQIMEAPLVRCDEIAWEFLGLSMASWNGLVCLGLAATWMLALRFR